MSNPPARSLIAVIVKNFINSFKVLAPKNRKGILIGTDYFGNKYYEIPAEPQLGRRRPSRWFEPVEKENFEQEMPAEWEAWLRGRRTQPPEESEVLKNLAIMQMKKKNAEELDVKYGTGIRNKAIADDSKRPHTFPEYNDYEYSPGNPQKKP